MAPLAAESPSDAAKETPPLRATTLLILTLLFLSGLAGLVYQILWMKQLGLLFGSTAYAASATLAAFFAGLAAGSWWWGARVEKSSNPLRLYALLEFGIALTALTYFIILKAFYAVYPHVYDPMAGPVQMISVKFLLALLLVFPPAFFMGGTVPAIARVLIRSRGLFGRKSAFIYGINTLGAAVGVSSAAFLLIPSLGFRFTYGLSVLLSLVVALISWQVSRRPHLRVTDPTPEAEEAKSAAEGPRYEHLAICLLCFFSGFTVLGLEVIWTRIFAQVHENSVYSFAIILTVVLVCLALGAWISAGLARLSKEPLRTLGILTIAGGSLLVLGPPLLMKATDGLRPVNTMEPWGEYVAGLFRMGFGGIGLVTIALGTVFPFLMKAVERTAEAPGRTLGRLLAINTAGAIAGALLSGFVLLPSLGMWGSMRFLSAAYLVLGLLLPFGLGHSGIVLRAVGIGSLALLFSALNPTRLPTHWNPPFQENPDRVLKTWEGADCTVTVVEKGSGHRAIKINGAYALGSTAAYQEQANQSRIPLHAFPETGSICYIGMGTGMSAGAALAPKFPKVERLVSCELTPAVVEAARTYIPEELTRGLFTDPRSTVLVEDGRHYIMAGDDKFDMINADLFLPYRRGAGSLYSLDHYQAAAERLNPDGVFVQWLPLYQLTEFEFGVIARTMLEAFDQVTMWRNNFTPGKEKVALIGQKTAAPLPPPPTGDREAMRAAVEGMEWFEASPEMVRAEADSIMFFYCGNLSAARDLFDSYPINTDDRPVIEYETPRTFRQRAEQEEMVFFVGPELARVTRQLLLACPVTEDPALQGHPASSQRLVLAGAAFHQAMIWKSLGQVEKGEEEWGLFKKLWQGAAE